MFTAEIETLINISKAIYNQVQLANQNSEIAGELAAQVKNVMLRVNELSRFTNLPNFVKAVLDNLTACFQQVQKFVDDYTSATTVTGTGIKAKLKQCKEKVMQVALAGRDCEQFKKLSADLEHHSNELSRGIETALLAHNYDKSASDAKQHQEILAAIKGINLADAKPKKELDRRFLLSDKASLVDYLEEIRKAFVSVPNQLFASVATDVSAREKYNPRFRKIEHELANISRDMYQFDPIRDHLSALWSLMAKAGPSAAQQPTDFQIRFEESLSVLEVKLGLNRLKPNVSSSNYFDQSIQAIQQNQIARAFELLIEATKDPATRAKAAYQLGKFYLYGKDQPNNPVSKDFTEAQKWFMIAGQEGMFKGLYQSVNIYAYGDKAAGLQPDLDKAEETVNQLLKLECTQQERDQAEFLLNLVHRKQYVLRATQGDIDSMFQAASMFYHGKGLPKAENEAVAKSYLDEAKKYATQASEKGHSGAAVLLKKLNGEYASAFPTSNGFLSKP